MATTVKKLSLLLLCLSFLPCALAHATFVIGNLRSQPVNPKANETFELAMDLADPTQLPVEDAFVLAEFSLGDEVISARFEETEVAGFYRTSLRLSEAGTYTLLLRDQTFRQEEATAELSFHVAGDNPEVATFIFPPTATGGNNLRAWLIWAIALPIVAGIIVTLLVLFAKKEN